MSDSAFKSAPYPAYTVEQLQACIDAGKGNPVMVAEIARRAAVKAGDVSQMTAGERLHRARQVVAS